MKKLISVLMPTYNRAHMISAAITSIMKQTYNDFELIIYDDGSTDNTEKIVSKFDDKRIQYIKGDKNRGCAWARNHMMKICNGDVACWQDSDDISNIHRITQQIKAIQLHDIVATHFQWMNKVKTGDWLKSPKLGGKMAHASVMFKMGDVLDVDLALSGGGSDADWLRRMRKKCNSYVLLDPILYYAGFHRDRIGVWKRKPNQNAAWSKRMAKYKDDK